MHDYTAIHVNRAPHVGNENVMCMGKMSVFGAGPQMYSVRWEERINIEIWRTLVWDHAMLKPSTR
jgi:hypothetical protein